MKDQAEADEDVSWKKRVALAAGIIIYYVSLCYRLC